MKPSRTLHRFAVLAGATLVVLLGPPGVHAQGRIEGQVTNGTTHLPVPNQEVLLLVPREGMQQVAKASTDATGRFVFSHSEIDPSSFYLLQTIFQGVHYPAPVQFISTGTATVNLTVYDSTRSDAALRIQSLRILIRAEGSKVRVQELYAVSNLSQPPRAYANSDGTFHFRLLSQATEPTVAVTGLLNMPLPQTPEPGKSPGEFSIRYPLKPGLTHIRVGYEADYSSARLALRGQVPYPIDRVEMDIFPSGLSVESPVFKPAGLDLANGIQKFEAKNLPRYAALDVRLSGEAASSSPSERSQGEEEIRTVPNSMTRLGVPLLICFLLVLLWALGVRVAKEWPNWKARRGASTAQNELAGKMEELFNSLADLDELFASRKIAERDYWKERLELKAKLVAMLKKAPPSLLGSYATRHIPR